MNQKEFIKHIEETYKRGVEIIKRKNSDYAENTDVFKNFRFAELVGVKPDRAILVRISDKLARISNLLEKENLVKDETIEDTLIDLINYSAILVAYLYEQKRHPKSN